MAQTFKVLVDARNAFDMEYDSVRDAYKNLSVQEFLKRFISPSFLISKITLGRKLTISFHLLMRTGMTLYAGLMILKRLLK